MSLDEEDDATLVLIQFSDLDDANYCQQFTNRFKTIDIQTNNPIIQIGNRLYSGEYTNNIGSYLFFEQTNKQTEKTNSDNNEQQEASTSQNKSQNNEESNSFNQENQNYKYFGKSFKKLVLSRLFVEEKQTEESKTSKE